VNPPLIISVGMKTCLAILIIEGMIDGVSAKFNPLRMELNSLVVVSNYLFYHLKVLDTMVSMHEIKIGFEILVVYALVYGSTST